MLANIINPTLLLDEERCRANISEMKKRVETHNVSFKPHFKTHQSREIGRWFREEGVKGITVSSLAMAEFFVSDGWNDITIAFPVNIKAISEINSLARRIDLTLLVDNQEAAKFLAREMTTEVDILIELDAGSQRTGIEIVRSDDISALVEVLTSVQMLNWKGFYSHFGHTYRCRDAAKVREVFLSSLGHINKMMERNGFFGKDLHIGDTPGCSLAESFPGITTMTPGNFVFYDIMQHQIGSCEASEIAVAMACPVVSKNRERKEITVHGGAVHFSKDNININGAPCFGVVMEFNGNKFGEADYKSKLISLSQEHGILKIKDEGKFSSINVGDLVAILPIHSCLTADCMKEYLTFGRQSDIIGHM